MLSPGLVRSADFLQGTHVKSKSVLPLFGHFFVDHTYNLEDYEDYWVLPCGNFQVELPSKNLISLRHLNYFFRARSQPPRG